MENLMFSVSSIDKYPGTCVLETIVQVDYNHKIIYFLSDPALVVLQFSVSIVFCIRALHALNILHDFNRKMYLTHHDASRYRIADMIIIIEWGDQ